MKKLLILILITMIFVTTGCSEKDFKEFEKLLDNKVEKLADKIVGNSLEKRKEFFENYYKTTTTKIVPKKIVSYMGQDISEIFKDLKININGEIYKIKPFYIDTEYRNRPIDTQLISKNEKKFIASIIYHIIKNNKQLNTDYGCSIPLQEKNGKFEISNETQFIIGVLTCFLDVYIAENDYKNLSMYEKLNKNGHPFKIIKFGKETIIIKKWASYFKTPEKEHYIFKIKPKIENNTIKVIAEKKYE